MEHLWKDPVLQMPEMFELQGSFYVWGLVGRGRQGADGRFQPPVRGVPGSPTTEEIWAQGVRVTLFVNEILKVRRVEPAAPQGPGHDPGPE